MCVYIFIFSIYKYIYIYIYIYIYNLSINIYQVYLLTLDNSLILQIILLVGSKNQVYLTYLKK